MLFPARKAMYGGEEKLILDQRMATLADYIVNFAMNPNTPDESNYYSRAWALATPAPTPARPSTCRGR